MPIIYKGHPSIIYPNRVKNNQQQTKMQTIEEDHQQSGSRPSEKEAKQTEKPLKTAANPVDKGSYSKKSEAMAWYMERKLRIKSRHSSGAKTPTDEVHRSRNATPRKGFVS